MLVPPRFLRGYQLGAIAPFALLHLGVAAAFFFPPSRQWLLWLAAWCCLRMSAVTAGYHRCFSHRSCKSGRWAQFCMAFLAQTSSKKGVLWWAAHHRQHHRHSDDGQDIHSPVQRGFCWPHVGWIPTNQYDRYDPKSVAHFARFPELRRLDCHHWARTVLYAAAILLTGGPGAFVRGYVVATLPLFHCTFPINSPAHVFGTRRFDTADHSRNNWLPALITFGEAPGLARDLRPFRIPAAAAREAK